MPSSVSWRVFLLHWALVMEWSQGWVCEAPCSSQVSGIGLWASLSGACKAKARGPEFKAGLVYIAPFSENRTKPRRCLVLSISYRNWSLVKEKSSILCQKAGQEAHRLSTHQLPLVVTDQLWPWATKATPARPPALHKGWAGWAGPWSSLVLDHNGTYDKRLFSCDREHILIDQGGGIITEWCKRSKLFGIKPWRNFITQWGGKSSPL
jgi:hypothetical protein